MNFCDLSGRTALVTGSSRGIGRAVGLLLAKLGARVIFHGSRESEKLASAVAEAGNGATSVAADLEKPDEVEKLAQTLSGSRPAPDILVLNASVQSYTTLADGDGAEFSRMFRANVESSLVLLRKLVPAMREKRFGRVIFVGSINGVRPAGRLAIYGATKAALMNVARTAAAENASFGITVNTILPGVIDTDRNAEKLSDAAFAETLRARIPMHRFGTPEDCAGIVAFLASEDAAYITGAEIPVDGGRLLD